MPRVESTHGERKKQFKYQAKLHEMCQCADKTTSGERAGWNDLQESHPFIDPDAHLFEDTVEGAIGVVEGPLRKSLKELGV
jgi:hypothetical protein